MGLFDFLKPKASETSQTSRGIGINLLPKALVGAGTAVLSAATGKRPEPEPLPAPKTVSPEDATNLIGLIDNKTLATANPNIIAEAVVNAGKSVAEQYNEPIDYQQPFVKRLLQPAKQAVSEVGGTLISQAQNVANIGLNKLGYQSTPFTPEGQQQAFDRFLEKYAPERLIDLQMKRLVAGEQPTVRNVTKLTTQIGEAIPLASTAIQSLRIIPAVQKMSSAGEAGVYATQFLENLVTQAAISAQISVGEGKPSEFPKWMLTNASFLLPTSTYGGLAIQTMASYLGNVALGHDSWEAVSNTVLGLAGAATQRKHILTELQNIRVGNMSRAMRNLIAGEMNPKVPQQVKEAAIDEAARLRAFYEQNPQDMKGLYDMTLSAEKRVLKLAQQQTTAKTGETRLIGLTGGKENLLPRDGAPKQPGPQEPPLIPKQEAMNMATDIVQEHRALTRNMRSKAEFGPEYEGAEINTEAAIDLIKNRETRGIIETLTGKKGYKAVTELDSAGLHEIVREALTIADPGSRAYQRLQKIKSTLRDDIDDDYFSESLQRAVDQRRGIIRPEKKRFTPDDLIEELQAMEKSGFVTMNSEISDGVTVKSLIDSLQNKTEISPREIPAAETEQLPSYDESLTRIRQAEQDIQAQTIPQRIASLQNRTAELATRWSTPKEAPAGPLKNLLQETERLRTAKPKSKSQAESLDNIIAKQPTPVREKVHILDSLATPSKVMEKMRYGEEAALIRIQYDKYLNELQNQLEHIGNWAKIAGEDADSSQLMFQYLNGDVGINALSEEQAKVAKDIRIYLNTWADLLGLPHDKRIENYITHIFDGKAEPEFDEDAARIMAQTTAKSVFDPFLSKRYNKEGYLEDAWSALEAYVKRATRKFYMDPALDIVSAKSNKMELTQYDFTKKYLDQLNMRPSDLDTLTDNFIKTFFTTKLGARPTMIITRTARRIQSRGLLALNIASVLKNMTQLTNSYAVLGEKYMLNGFIKAAKYMASSQRNERIDALLRESFVQDRHLHPVKQAMQKIDKVLYSVWDLTEKINRIPTYFGAEAKYLEMHPEATAEEVHQYAARIVRDTQFSFDPVDMPIAIRGDIGRTIFQLSTYPIKQTEFLAHLIRNREFKALTRYMLGTIVILGTVGKFLGLEWRDFVPGIRFLEEGFLPPVLRPAVDVGKAALNTRDEYGKKREPQGILGTPMRIFEDKDVRRDMWYFFPAGSQARKTITGLKAISEGEVRSNTGKTRRYSVSKTPWNTLRAIIFGPSGTKEGREWLDEYLGRTKHDLSLQSVIKYIRGNKAQQKNKLLNDIDMLKLGDLDIDLNFDLDFKL